MQMAATSMNVTKRFNVVSCRLKLLQESFDDIMAGTSTIQQSKTILARSWAAGPGIWGPCLTAPQVDRV